MSMKCGKRSKQTNPTSGVSRKTEYIKLAGELNNIFQQIQRVVRAKQNPSSSKVHEDSLNANLLAAGGASTARLYFRAVALKKV